MFGGRCWGLDQIGIRLLLDGNRVLVKFKFTVFLADFEAHAMGFSFKGASGSVPCMRCRNVVGRCGYFDNDPNLLHIWSP
eukprot:7121024-Pyramimonas_sp.AAC.1